MGSFGFVFPRGERGAPRGAGRPGGAERPRRSGALPGVDGERRARELISHPENTPSVAFPAVVVKGLLEAHDVGYIRPGSPDFPRPGWLAFGGSSADALRRHPRKSPRQETALAEATGAGRPKKKRPATLRALQGGDGDGPRECLEIGPIRSRSSRPTGPDADRVRRRWNRCRRRSRCQTPARRSR